MSVKREFTFDSGDGRTKIHAVEWRPEKGEICGVLQIFHGMVEFIERYEETAEYLTERGFVVVGNDHLGHGRSIVSKEEYGFFCENDGNAVVLGDLRRLHEKAKKKWPKVPYFILGHSMGSFFCRVVLARSRRPFAGAVIMGTGYKTKAVLTAAAALTGCTGIIRGWKHKSPVLQRLVFGQQDAGAHRAGLFPRGLQQHVVFHCDVGYRGGILRGLLLCRRVGHQGRRGAVDGGHRGAVGFFYGCQAAEVGRGLRCAVAGKRLDAVCQCLPVNPYRGVKRLRRGGQAEANRCEN